MPNGGDKNFIRLCAAIDGFRVSYKAWPTAVRLHVGMIADLRDHVLEPDAFARVEAKLRLIPDDAVNMVAEDGAGRTYSYDEKGVPTQEPVPCARDWLGVRPLEGVEINHAIEAALHIATQPNYLGDLSVIERILTELWQTVFNRWNAGVADADAAVKADTDAAERVARIFLGMDPAFVSMSAWNRPGIIDRHIAEVLDIADTEPVLRVAYALLSYLSELMNLVAAVKANTITGEEFQQQSGGVVGKYRNMLMGYVEPTITKQDLAATDDTEDDDETPI